MWGVLPAGRFVCTEGFFRGFPAGGILPVPAGGFASGIGGGEDFAGGKPKKKGGPKID